MEQIKRIKINGKEYEIKGDSVFIRYSANADGTDYTETWSEGQGYVGYASGLEAPVDKDGYTWMSTNGENLVQWTKQYVPKVSTKNLLAVTWQNATIDSGKFRTKSTRDGSASPDYIAVTGGANYTFSCIKSSVRTLVYVHEYSDTNETAYIKSTRTGATNDNTMPATITLDAKCAYVRIHLYAPTAPTSWEELIPDNFQMESGTEATFYVPPSPIDNDILDVADLANRMQANGSIPKTDGYINSLPSTEQLPVSVWEYGALSNDDGSETTTNPVEARVRTKGYIQLNKGDVITSTRSMDVFEYDPITLEYLGGADGWISSYTIQNDCFVRILVNNYNKVDLETVAAMVTITHNSNSRIKFIALPLDEMREWTDRLIDEKAEKDYVTKTKFSAVKNTLLKQSAHRGYRGTGAPQCTAPAYIEAKKYGYDVGENDMWVTTDGVFVMAHNTTLPSDSSIVIAESTYATLYAGNMGTFNGKEVKIMTLEEWLILMKKIGLEPFVDIKSNLTAEQATAVVAIARKHGMLDKVIWCKGASDTIRGIRASYPKAKIALLGATTVNTEFVIDGRPDLTVIYPQSINVTAEVVENAHNAGVGVECWHCDYSANGFTTEEAILAEVERVVELGVTGICLDTYLPCDYFIKKLNAEWGLE